MAEINRKLPVGIQSFPNIVNNHYLYVDKTEYIYKLVHEGNPYFLNRPRRFGKSLLLSTLKAYWEGRKDLFTGLKIEKLEEENEQAWQPHPVFYFDFNGTNYQNEGALEIILSDHLSEWEEQYCTESKEYSLGTRFQRLLKKATELTGHRCVILVDEYDKSLLETMDDPALLEHNKAVFKGFFSVLKSSDDYIRFVFITGVTKFSKVSLFSDINQLRDISMNPEYAAICGITENEMVNTFEPEISRLAAVQSLSHDECILKLKETYDGYHFCHNVEGVYNPFSLLNSLADKDFQAYWFVTGTPTFLVKRLKEIGFDVRKFTDRTLYTNQRMLSDYRSDNPDPIPLLYQTGYLTIWDYDPNAREYILGFPNEEVKYSFLECLMPVYVESSGSGSGKDIFTLKRYIENGEPDQICNILSALFASIPYSSNDFPFEHYFQAVIYIIFTLLGQYTHCEMHTSTGRIDCTVETGKYAYIFEFKRDKSAKEALQQIKDYQYALPFASDLREVFLIGVNFDSHTRSLEGWVVEKL